MLRMPFAKVVEAPDERPGKKGKIAHYHPANASYFNAAARLAESADNIGRMAAGMPTSNARVTGKHGVPLGGTQPIIRNIVVSPESAKLREIRKRFGKRPPGL